MTEDWSRWYTRTFDAGIEKCFVELKPSIPSHVDTVIDFGCAAGRNLALFNGDFRLVGVDLPAEDGIEWRVPFRDLTYIQSQLQDFPQKFPGSMEHAVCIAHGTLMYLDPEEQGQLLAALADRGCKNYIFQEYDAETLNRDRYWEPTLGNRLRRRRVGYAFRNPLGFEERWFRPEIPTWFHLEAQVGRDQ